MKNEKFEITEPGHPSRGAVISATALEDLPANTDVRRVVPDDPKPAMEIEIRGGTSQSRTYLLHVVANALVAPSSHLVLDDEGMPVDRVLVRDPAEVVQFLDGRRFVVCTKRGE